jgi:hypothetical protein
MLFRFYIVRLLFLVKSVRIELNVDLDLKAEILDDWVDSLTIKNVVKGFFNIKGVDLYIFESDDYFRRGKRKKKIRRKRVHAYPF